MEILGMEVVEVTLLRLAEGQDTITFTLEGPSPFPEMAKEGPERAYRPELRLKLRRGYGEEWLTQTNISDYTLLDYTRERIPFCVDEKTKEEED